VADSLVQKGDAVDLSTELDDGKESNDAVAFALRAAAEAAATANAWMAVDVLWRSPVLDGVIRRIQRRWPWLPEDDVNRATAEAFEALHAAVMAGGTVRDPVHWLSRVARNRAAQIMRDRSREIPVADQSWLSLGEHGGEPESILAADERRARAVAHARRLLPRLGQANVQAVMEVVIDAVERQVPSLSVADIALALGQSQQTVKVWYWRGFERLRRLAAEEGLAAEDFRLEVVHNEEDD
jgi:DNA-directed RNA polymerase specialized sigma24 family protein